MQERICGHHRLSSAKRSQGSGFQRRRRIFCGGQVVFTCFANPVHVAVHLLLQLLLLLQEQEASAGLHPVLLLGKLAGWKTVIRAADKYTKRFWEGVGKDAKMIYALNEKNLFESSEFGGLTFCGIYNIGCQPAWDWIT